MVFDNTNRAIKSEKLLLDAEIKVTVRPLPPEIKAGCGIALAINENELFTSKALLEENEIIYQIYSTDDDKSYSKE